MLVASGWGDVEVAGEKCPTLLAAFMYFEKRKTEHTRPPSRMLVASIHSQLVRNANSYSSSAFGCPTTCARDCPTAGAPVEPWAGQGAPHPAHTVSFAKLTDPGNRASFVYSCTPELVATSRPFPPAHRHTTSTPHANNDAVQFRS